MQHYSYYIKLNLYCMPCQVNNPALFQLGTFYIKTISKGVCNNWSIEGTKINITIIQVPYKNPTRGHPFCSFYILGFWLKKKNFMAPFFGWGSTVSKLEPLRGESLLFTTKFPEISGTHFIDLGRVKGWVNLGTTHWFWTRGLWIGNPAT